MSGTVSEAGGRPVREDIGFGRYAPNLFQSAILRMTRALPDTWLGRRASFALRRLVVMFLRHPLDVEVFGRRMRLYPFNNVTEKRVLFTPQFFDPAERKLLADFAGDGMVFLDIGANIGAYTMFVAGLGLKNARLIAIEPQPDLFERLTTNISLNSDQPVKAIACAISDKDGEMTMFVHARNKGQSSVRILGWENEEGESLRVATTTLLGLLRGEGLTRLDAVKIDVEGAEDLILAPFFRDAPQSVWPRMIIIENAPERWHIDCIELCRDLGYTLVLKTKLNVIMRRGE